MSWSAVSPPSGPDPASPGGSPFRAGAADAAIHDRGYQPYRGERTGTRGAMRAVFVQTIQRVMGMRRSARHKIVPWLTVAIAYLQAIGTIAVAGVFGGLAEDLGADAPLSKDAYLEVAFGPQVLIVVFAAVAAAEALCPDRRDGLATYYLVSQLDRRLYTFTKWTAVVSLMSLVTVGPAMLTLVGLTILGQGPGGPLDVLDTSLRISGVGLLVATSLATVCLGIASLMKRTGPAVAVIVGTMIATSTVAEILRVSGRTYESVFASPTLAIVELASRIFGGVTVLDTGVESVGDAAVASAWALWIVVSAAVLAARMLHLEATR
ncbi:MAG: hypothetical protein KatS3mg008_1361 [Acidimicrobiales bacterium]|nr:MAG: hypothetical protein KatS3mg008_1361 [Acidimicrobiales bacterium]